MNENKFEELLLSGLIIEASETVSSLLSKLSQNKRQIIYIIESRVSRKTIGAVNYGDLLRWLSKHSDSLDDIIFNTTNLINNQFIHAKHGTSEVTIQKLLDKYGSIPLLNDDKSIAKLLFAKKYNDEITVGKRVISNGSPPFYVAEIGNNHNGNFDLALNLIRSAKESGADAVKFQARQKELYKTDATDLGNEYVNDLISRFTLDFNQLDELACKARSEGLSAIVTPFDIDSLENLNSKSWDAIKIASVDLVNHELLNACKDFKLPLIISTGMSTEQNIVEAYEIVADHMQGFCFLHCNSTYPAPFSDIHLEFLNTLKKLVGPIVGYSGHELGYHIANSAIIYGARLIEKHFTFDKTMIGNDHKISLTPVEFKEMIAKGSQIFQALGINKGPNRLISQGEKINKKSLGKSYIYKSAFRQGEVINLEKLRQVPGSDGITPEFIKKVVGKRLLRSVHSQQVVYEADFIFETRSKKTVLNTNFGIPVRFHDVVQAIQKISPKFVEYHLSASDMDRLQEVESLPNIELPFAVHAPEQFKNDFIINFSDKQSLKRSFALIDKVFEIGEVLKSKHPKGVLKGGLIPIILNAGGFTLKEQLNHDEKDGALNTLCESLTALKIPPGFKVLCQTMPPYPWLYGGSAYHNLLTELSDVKIVSELLPEKIGICVDVSHTVMWLLARGNYSIESVQEYIEYSDYLHIADVENERSEGLQISHGIIDFARLGKTVREKDLHWVTEVWMGHANNFEGCAQSLKQLEKFGW